MKAEEQCVPEIGPVRESVVSLRLSLEVTSYFRAASRQVAGAGQLRLQAGEGVQASLQVTGRSAQGCSVLLKRQVSWSSFFADSRLKALCLQQGIDKGGDGGIGWGGEAAAKCCLRQGPG